MKIEILHTRDPDAGCEHTIFVDGVRVDSGIDIEDVDPSRGWQRSDWDERIADAMTDTTRSEEFRELVVRTLEAYADNEFVEGD